MLLKSVKDISGLAVSLILVLFHRYRVADLTGPGGACEGSFQTNARSSDAVVETTPENQ